MSNAKKCDRCGELFQARQRFRRYEVREDVLKNSTTPSIRHKRRDLCKDCYKGLKEWYEND